MTQLITTEYTDFGVIKLQLNDNGKLEIVAPFLSESLHFLHYKELVDQLADSLQNLMDKIVKATKEEEPWTKKK
jgi:hypothetical protein